MSSSANANLKPLVVHGVKGPNPPKVRLLIKELGLPITEFDYEFPELKKEAYLKINPNGRMPAIEDPNTGIKLWESGAILLYIAETYDTENRFSFPAGSKEAHEANQWLFYQVSGQGPYYGQFVWFNKWHPEKVDSAVERYLKEVKRVTGVLEEHLKGKPEEQRWIVGGKYSFVDMAWLAWQIVVQKLGDGKYDPDEFPVVKAWMGRILERKIAQEVFAVIFGGHADDKSEDIVARVKAQGYKVRDQ